LPLTAAALESASGASGLAAATPSAPDAADSSLFAQGTRAINETRWADAVRIFANVAAQHGEHADGALYWKAYAEDKLGQFKPAEDTCATLRGAYPRSGWIDDCGALEVEIRARTGKPVRIKPGQSDEVKLLALNAMMRQDEPRALQEIETILNGDSSESLKKEAQFILGQHYSNATYAQIVRISRVEGDVRIQRGAANGKADNGSWEKAVADLPLETGFSLATGAGRAEIEFENASTLYLGENSILTFNDLHSTAGVPYSELGLLSGTVSLYIHPYVAGERFYLMAPTDELVSKYPDRTYVRVESFADATRLTPLEGGDMRLPGVPKDSVVPGRTWTFRRGVPAAAMGTPSDEQFSAWDKWVNARVSARAAAISAVMEASGLTAPIPGMADMAGQGTFFDCAPYGTCWEPKDADSHEEAANQKPRAQDQPKLVLASFDPSSPGGRTAQANAPTELDGVDSAVDFPCTPESLRYRLVRDPMTGKTTVVDRKLVSNEPYNWAVCHAGSWIRHERHYAWVAGGKRRHVEPVRWVKSGHRVGFVPLHPYDVKDQPALNAKHIVFEVAGKNEIRLEPVKLDSRQPIEFLKEPPREYRNDFLRPLARVEEPRMEAHAFAGEPGRGGVAMSRTSIPIHFDPKSLNFVVARQEVKGGWTTTVMTPITNRSRSLQSRAGIFSGGNGLRNGGSSTSGSNFPGRDPVSRFHDRGGSNVRTPGTIVDASGSGGSSGGGASHGGGSNANSGSGSGSHGGGSSGGTSAGSSSAVGSAGGSSASSSGSGAHR
jgi:hypothetical protein